MATPGKPTSTELSGDAEQALEALAGRLRVLQERTPLSLRALAQRTHVSASALSRYFTGQAMPSLQVVELLAEVCGGDVDELRASWEVAATARQRVRLGANRPAEQVTGEDGAVGGGLRWPGLRWPSLRAASAVAGVLTLLLLTAVVTHAVTLRYGVDVQAPTGAARAGVPAPSASADAPAPTPSAGAPSSAPSPSGLPARPAAHLPAKTAPHHKPGATAAPPPARSPAPPVPKEMFTSELLPNACMDAHGGGEHPVYTDGPCSPDHTAQLWALDVFAEPQSHNGQLAVLRNVATGQCLDSNGVGDGEAWVKRCNSDTYQVWELFTVPATDPAAGSVTVFKSWGAWKHGESHRCIYVDSAASTVKMRTCNTDDAHQRWS